MLFAVTPFVKVKAQPNCSAASTTETCNTSQTLNSFGFPGWAYTWFETNIGGGNGVLLNNGIPTNTITLAPTQTTYDEIHYYIEQGQNQYAPFNTSTSGVRTVKFSYELKIVANNQTPPIYSISIASSIVYTNYQWYNNGAAIPGATSSTYIPYISGAYTLRATNSCGNTLTSNILTYTAPTCSGSKPTYATCNANYILSSPATPGNTYK